MKNQIIACLKLEYKADEMLQLARVNAVLTNGTIIKDYMISNLLKTNSI